MAESSFGKKLGRPRKTTVRVKLELTQQQVLWLNELVDSGCHGPDKESILGTWIAERFRQLRDSGELRRLGVPTQKSNIVELGEEKNPALSGNAASYADPNQNTVNQTVR